MRRLWIALFITAFVFIGKVAVSQDGIFKMRNYRPVSPTAFEFLKYTEMPVTEYRGLPGISIPLYQIEEDGVTIPISLSYHAGGFRVSDEASWVGLGWDMTFGSIVQNINDVDDYSVNPNVVKKLPDWNTSFVPSYLPARCEYSCATDCSGYEQTVPVNAPQPFHSYKIATNYYFPIGGNADNQALGELIVNDWEYDSEPDIFQANFLGHSITFVRKFSNSDYQIIVLNKSGYRVDKTAGGFCIYTPQGDCYYFEIFSSTTTTPSIGPVSKVWMLTKIITKNKRQILFTYSESPNSKNIPSASFAFYYWNQGPVYTYTDPCIPSQTHAVSNGGPGSLELNSMSITEEKRVYLNTITFTNGTIDFIKSSRLDLHGGSKLDRIEVKAGPKLIKAFDFNYSDFDAPMVPGSPPLFTDPALDIAAKKRLKLNSIVDNAGASHIFNYNATQLPHKVSIAQDYWGFYNGAANNPSMIPNPARLGRPELGDNDVNSSSNLAYTQACILNEIQYPTGGKTIFEYELNQFDNYWVPDFLSTTNTVSSGNGLRIRSVIFKADQDNISKKVEYSYFGGKDLQPKNMIQTYNRTAASNNSGTLTVRQYTVTEVNAKGFFSSTPLSSGSGVGYDKVIKRELNLSGASLGSTETYFNNNPDIVNNSAIVGNIVLPVFKKRGVPENGTTHKIVYKNDQGNIVRETVNTYQVINSDTYFGLFYGAKFFGYGSLFYGYPPPGSYFLSLPETLIGFYPIFDKQSLLVSATTKEYDELNNEITVTNGYGYNIYGQMINQTLSSSRQNSQYNQTAETKIEYGSENSIPGGSLLSSANRHSDPSATFKRISKGPSNYYPRNTDYDKVTHEYMAWGNKVVLSKTIINAHPGPGEQPSEITYNLYDEYANLLEYTAKGQKHSLIWDYSGKYVTAEVANAGHEEIAATSFETESGSGNWSDINVNNIVVSEEKYVMTGSSFYQSDGITPLSKYGLSNSKTYIVSYWTTRTTPFDVTGSISPEPIKGKTINRDGKQWTYYQHTVAHVDNVTVNGSGDIDELRLHPADARMLTYTYEPLVGLLTQCDINNNIVRYIYDTFFRLQLLKNTEGNILKKYEYKYHNQ